MYQCRNINRNARCVMSTCNTQLQLILLNSFVFLTSFVLLSGKGHFLMTDHRRKDPKFKFTPRKSSLNSVLTDPTSLLHFSLLQRLQDKLLDWEAKRSTWKFSKGFKVLLFKCKLKWVLLKELKPQEMAEGMTGTVTVQGCRCSLQNHVQDSWLALTGVILKIISNYPVKKIQPINKTNRFDS